MQKLDISVENRDGAGNTKPIACRKQNAGDNAAGIALLAAAKAGVTKFY